MEIGKVKGFGGKGIFGDFLARARGRENDYLGSDSFPRGEMLSCLPPLQELLAEAQYIAPAVKWMVKYL